MAQAIAFWVFAVIAVLAAVAVVWLRNIFRAALLLLLCFFSVAGIFITLGADFLAAVQVLLYVGAIGVLLLMAVMLTRDIQLGSRPSRWRLPAAILGLALMLIMVWAVVKTPWATPSLPSPQPTAAGLASSLFDLEAGWVFPFEIASLLLLVAIIGAIVLVREK